MTCLCVCLVTKETSHPDIFTYHCRQCKKVNGLSTIYVHKPLLRHSLSHSLALVSKEAPQKLLLSSSSPPPPIQALFTYRIQVQNRERTKTATDHATMHRIDICQTPNTTTAEEAEEDERRRLNMFRALSIIHILQQRIYYNTGRNRNDYNMKKKQYPIKRHKQDL